MKCVLLITNAKCLFRQRVKQLIKLVGIGVFLTLTMSATLVVPYFKNGYGTNVKCSGYGRNCETVSLLGVNIIVLSACCECIFNIYYIKHEKNRRTRIGESFIWVPLWEYS